MEVIEILVTCDIIFISEMWRKRNPYNVNRKSHDHEILGNLGFTTIEFLGKDSILGKPGRGPWEHKNQGSDILQDTINYMTQ